MKNAIFFLGLGLAASASAQSPEDGRIIEGMRNVRNCLNAIYDVSYGSGVLDPKSQAFLLPVTDPGSKGKKMWVWGVRPLPITTPPAAQPVKPGQQPPPAQPLQIGIHAMDVQVYQDGLAQNTNLSCFALQLSPDNRQAYLKKPGEGGSWAYADKPAPNAQCSPLQRSPETNSDHLPYLEERMHRETIDRIKSMRKHFLQAQQQNGIADVGRYLAPLEPEGICGKSNIPGIRDLMAKEKNKIAAMAQTRVAPGEQPAPPPQDRADSQVKGQTPPAASNAPPAVSSTPPAASSSAPAPKAPPANQDDKIVPLK